MGDGLLEIYPHAPATPDRETLERWGARIRAELGSTRTFYHGTRAEFRSNDLIAAGSGSNYTERTANWVYFSETLNAAAWGAELARGDTTPRIFQVEPTGDYVDDPNVTDKRFPGNPTKSYRSRAPLRVVREVHEWVGHSDDEIAAMRAAIAGKSPEDD
jgi:rifampin ADP-ribosylating transferase